ncbi:hypothetical protein [Cryobacterium tagatosivorans]|uniref:Uncharacterized protein n=1 Tax=Cryobacterium tagatosivorans TaxID=1259199 RepID=A0A4R8UJT8_9MICO|nr:hypothetical protein [Cryobacterium tagatosivorans]TFB55156.1 hypothetical protein E3O23_02710 [Cryobacterium tagatosivorans]
MLTKLNRDPNIVEKRDRRFYRPSALALAAAKSTSPRIPAWVTSRCVVEFLAFVHRQRAETLFDS